MNTFQDPNNENVALNFQQTFVGAGVPNPIPNLGAGSTQPQPSTLDPLAFAGDECLASHLRNYPEELDNFRTIRADLDKLEEEEGLGDRCFYHTITKKHEKHIYNGLCTYHLRLLFNIKPELALINCHPILLSVGYEALPTSVNVPVMPLLAFVPPPARQLDKVAKLKHYLNYFMQNMRGLEIFKNATSDDRAEVEKCVDYLAKLIDESVAQLKTMDTHFHWLLWIGLQKNLLRVKELQRAIVYMSMSPDFYEKMRPFYGKYKWFQTDLAVPAGGETSKGNDKYLGIPYEIFTDPDKLAIQLFMPVNYPQKIFRGDETNPRLKTTAIGNVTFHDGVIYMGGGAGVPFCGKDITEKDVLEKDPDFNFDKYSIDNIPHSELIADYESDLYKAAIFKRKADTACLQLQGMAGADEKTINTVTKFRFNFPNRCVN